MSNELSKARTKVTRQDGDSHPSNPRLVWSSSAAGGKGDWRVRKDGDKGSKDGGSSSPKKSGDDGASASKYSVSDLKKVINDPNASDQAKAYAKKQLASQGVGDDDDNPAAKPTPKASPKPAKSDDDGGGEEDNKPAKLKEGILPRNAKELYQYEDDGSWYLDKNHPAIKKALNLDTVSGRKAYDKFVDTMKRKNPRYKGAKKEVGYLMRNYLQFIEDDNDAFMISAGGAGIGKTWGFKEICRRRNKVMFDPNVHEAGDANYDVFEAPNVKSENQLFEVLKEHNGKIILFDDTDDLIRKADMAAIMKKATISGVRIIGKANDPKTNFSFTGRIIVMTNKNLSDIAAMSEDAKAIMSRGVKSDVMLTKAEQMEVIRDRIFKMDLAVPPLVDKDKDQAERQAILDFIEENIEEFDPAQFSTRTIQEIAKNKRAHERALNAANDDEDDKEGMKDLMAIDDDEDIDEWKEFVYTKIFKGEDDLDLYKAHGSKEARRKRAEDDEVDYEVDLEKATDAFYGSVDVSLEEAKALLLG